MNDSGCASKLVLALVMTNSGGEGKSTWAETLAAFGRLADLNVVVADVDPGNRGYLNRNGDDSALSLDWSTSDTEKAPSDATAWFEAHLADRDLAILDTGANMLAAANEINRFVGQLIEIARARGARIVIYGVTSPNKPGSDELIEIMYQRFRRGAEVVVVKNDRDGSGDFKDSIAGLGTPVITLLHVAAGLLAVRMRRSASLDHVLTNPEPGYEQATAIIAKLLLVTARQDAVVDIVGKGVIGRLETLAAKAPVSTYYTISNLDLATDARVAASAAMSAASHQFRLANKADHEAFRFASLALRDAQDDWNALNK